MINKYSTSTAEHHHNNSKLFKFKSYQYIHTYKLHVSSGFVIFLMQCCVKNKNEFYTDMSLFVDVMFTAVFLDAVSLGYLPPPLCPLQTHTSAGGMGWWGNVRCIIYRSSSMSMLCAHFPVTF